jgi:Protein of unknown function (DUF1588)/Protein of unknown function (DUF1592)/Protein of unknown function (DUF1585)/Protein of unknown function (DUF1595)
VVAVVTLVACGHVSKRNESNSGGGTAAGGSGNEGGSGATGGSDLFEPCPGMLPPEVPMRALREPELTNELQVFGQPLDGEVFPEPYSRLFAAGPEPEATLAFVQGHADFVSGLAKRVTTDAAAIGAWLDCDVVASGPDCTKKLFDFVIDRLFRGRQQPETMSELQQVFDTGQKLGGDFKSGARALLEVALQSPEFLYRVELGRPVDGRSAQWSQPTDMEMASRLSFLLWNRGPDDELLSAAAQGRLTEVADIGEQARRMLADARAPGAIVHFYRELLRMTGDAHFDPGASAFTPEILQLMDQEFAGFVNQATFEGPGDFSALFAPVTSLNGPLASYYGLPGAKGETFQSVGLDRARYAGILTQPAWLTRASSPQFTNPSKRGWIVASALRCQDVPPEPPGVNDPAPTQAGVTTRERLSIHGVNPVCAACHQLIDPPGFALEHIDATGRYRETENGFAIDTTGRLAPDGPAFDGPAELGARLATSDDARQCFVTQWERFAFGRAEEESSECTRSELRTQFSGNENVVELLIALTQTESFRFRKVQP